MKKSLQYCLLSMLCWAGLLNTATAQTHYVGISPKLGYAAMLDNKFSSNNLDGFDLRTQGGVIGGMSFFYELKKEAFRFQTGLDFDYINSTSRITDFTVDGKMTFPYDMVYHYNFQNWKETRNSFYMQVPVLFGAQVNRFFFFAGPKVAIPLAGGYSSRGTVNVTGTHSKLPADLENIYTHEMLPTDYRYKGKLALRPTVSLALEAGIDLDRWLASPPPRRKRGQARKKRTFKQLLHYRASVFADYAFLNTNNYAANTTNAQPYIKGVSSDYEGRLPVFANGSNRLEGMNTALATDGAQKMNLNPLTIGVKFTIMYEFEKPIPPKKTPRPKPQPKPKPKPQPKPEAPKYYLCGIVEDKETMARLSDAVVEIYDTTGERSLYAVEMGNDQSAFESKLEPGTYMAYIRKAGYLPYSGIFSFQKDTVHFALQEVKEKVVTLLDVHFATNKTVVLPESDQVLEDLYDFLTENPTVRIRIVGHTDNVGTLEANQRLSEGRARSVTNEMVKRGIDRHRIEYEGKGKTAPVATNDTEEGRAKNRRVEFIILSK
ncbi:MAG TPA: hypothetical protein DIW30_00840 [Bacteroidales bacterium]|nr:hypothetical protein [Bacteroidales bacterium]